MTAHLRRVVLESPFAGKGTTKRERVAAEARNRRYAQAALYDCLIRGEAPIASHLLHTQALDDNVPAHRRIGIDAGLAWTAVADVSVFYVDFEMSTGMNFAFDRCVANGTPYEIRRLPKELFAKFAVWPKPSVWPKLFALACGLFAGGTIAWAVLYG